MRPQLLVAGTLAIVFGAGALSARMVARLRAGTVLPDGGTTWATLLAELDLSARQQQQIDSIFAVYQPKTDAVLLELAPRLQALADSMDAAILPVLTPAQRAVVSRARTPQLFMVRRKMPGGERVDTFRVQGRPR